MVSRISITLLALAFTHSSSADQRFEEDVVYGVMSGQAMLMDVYYPAESAGIAAIFIAGSGWDGREIGYTNYELKDRNPYYDALFSDLTNAGITIFSINHRMAPVHKYPAAVDDARRAVRFVRANAERYSVSSNSIAAIGHSSGGHLASLLGVIDDDAGNPDNTPISEYSSRVQAVVAIAAPQDLTINSRVVAPFTASFIGDRPPMDENFEHFLREGVYAEASPISHVTPDDAAFLLIYATQDDLVDVEHARIMHEAAQAVELTSEILIEEARTHSPTLDGELISGWLIRQMVED